MSLRTLILDARIGWRQGRLAALHRAAQRHRQRLEADLVKYRAQSPDAGGSTLGYCDAERGEAACNLDRGHDGPHAQYAAGRTIAWERNSERADRRTT